VFERSPDREGPISRQDKVAVVVEGGGGDTEVGGGRVPDGMARAVDEPEIAFCGMELEVGSRVDGDGACGPDGNTSRVHNGC
jgi:hypothetical protein